MTHPATGDNSALTKNLVEVLDKLSGGPHPGFRNAHAKGMLLKGTFTPSPGAASLTRAPHAHRASTPITVRFSLAAGVANVADNDPQKASPQGMAIRFHLADHVHTDIIGQSYDGFPTHTPEEFLEFLQAAAAGGPDAPKPTPVEKFLGAHPKALAFVMAPKPIPVSLATESFFSVTAYKFISGDGSVHFGRYRILPESGNQHLDDAAAAEQSPNFLFDEIADRVNHGPVKYRVMLQLAADGDIVDDATEHWPESRPQAEFGAIALTGRAENDTGEQRHIIFDPIPRVDGIESSGDPLLEVRSSVYLMAGRRHRHADVK
jgi:catalase